jgi:hypothetical protein
MPVEKTTPQLVKKGKGKKRPGYRGDAAYGRSSRSSQATSIGQARGATGPGGGASLGGGRDKNEQPAQQFIGGKSYNVTPETRGERDRAQLKQQIMNQTKLGGNRIDKFGNTKKSLFGGGGGGIGSLLASLFGLAMGIPGLGLLTGGFGKLKQGLGSLGDTLGDFREKFTGFKTQAEYDQAMFDKRQQKRLDKLFAAKDRGYNQIGFGDFTKKTMDFTPGQQAKIDDLLAQGYTPSTARNVLTGRDLKGFTESRGLQTPQTFSDPFRNTVGTTTKVNTTNDAVSSNSIPTVNGVPMINTGSVYQDNLNFFDNLNKGIVEGGTLTDNYKYKVPFEGARTIVPNPDYKDVMKGSVLDAQPKKGIMQMISDAIFTPAGADEFDMEAFQKAGADKGFFGANDELEAMKEYYDAAKSLSAPGSKFAGATNPNEIRSFIETQSNIPFGGGSYSVNMDMVPTNFMNTTEDFTTQKDPLSFFADGGLASMFTRRR